MYQTVQSLAEGGQLAETAHMPRERLLRAAVEYVAEHGVADLTLRRLAAAIGTSHRMLIYHFGSKQGLLIEVVRAVEEQQRETMAAFDVAPSMAPGEITRRTWARLSDPALWPSERLFFEMYGQALQARPHTVDFVVDLVESWLEPIAVLRRAQGIPPERARAQARLDLAVTRGLLLDLLATGDQTGVADAVEQSIALFESWSAGTRAHPGVTNRTATQSIECDVDPDAVLALMADPRRIPAWAPRLAETVTGDVESGWQVATGGQDFALRVAVSHEARTVDYVRELTPDLETCVYLRTVLRPDGGSVIIMTRPVALAADATVVATSISGELQALAALAERR